MADWDFLDEVDVLAKLSGNFKELLESKKWTERKEALEQLLGLITANPKLSTKANYGEIVNTLQVVLAKDANINVNALAAKCLSGIAAGLRTKFSPFVNQIIPIISDRFKEKKPVLKDPLIECIDAITATVQIENICEEIVAGMEKANPQIKQQMDNYIFRQMNKIDPSKAPKKLIKAVAPILTKHGSDADGEVREAALAALGSIQRLIGDKNVKSLIGDLEKDDNKMKKICEGATKAAELYAEYSASVSPPSNTRTKEVVVDEGDTNESAPSSARAPSKTKEADPWDFADPFDVLSKMPSSFDGENGVESKKWQERRDALQALLDLLTANIKLCPKGNYAELVGTLRKMLEKDANINVNALAAKCITNLATGLRAKFGSHASTVTPAILEKFKEKKPILKDPLVECIDAVLASTNLENLEECLVVALGKPNPNIKSQTDLFLKRAFMKCTVSNMPKKTLKALVPFLVKHTGDSDSDVRESAAGALGAVMAVIGEKPCMTMLADIADDKIKMAKIKENFDILKGEVEQNEPIPPPVPPPKTETKGPPSKGPMKKIPPKDNDDDDDEKNEQPQKNTTAKVPPKKVVKEEQKEEEDEEVKKKSEDILSVNEDKKMRIKDEKTLKILKWNFVTPDDEHTNQLMTLLGQQTKASLVALLFHKDFKQHLKAIDELNKVGESEPMALVKNSDLILKWCTLRFFETNPAALIKVLELALRILSLCEEMEEPMSNEEVNAFMPYLLLKSGEQKENMRMVVRDIVDILSNICGPVKLCQFVIDALKTKNSRQRTECLLVLEKYVTTNGLAQFKALGILKAMAGCVSDRDTNVRNAAINGLVAAYRDEGDRIWQAAGKLEAKDKQMVDERIKRSGAAPGSARPLSNNTTPANGIRQGAKIVSQQNGTVVRGRASSRDGNRTRDSSPVTSRGLNTTFDANRGGREEKRKYDLDDDDDVYLPQEQDKMSLSQMIAQLEANQIAAPVRMGGALKRTNSNSSIGSSVVDSIEALDKVIQNVSSAIADISIEAIEQLGFVLGVEEQRPLLRARVNILLPAIAAQVKLIRSFVDRPDEERLVDRMKGLLNFLVNFTLTSTDLRCASSESLEPYLYEFIWTLHEPRFKCLPNFEQVIRSINKIIIKSCSMSEPNEFFSALVNCIVRDMQSENFNTIVLFTKCMCKFTEAVREPMDLDVVANTANVFYTNIPLSERQHEVVEDASKAIHAVIENVFTKARANPREVFNGVINLDNRLKSRIDAWSATLAPVQIHPLIINICKDLSNMSKTIPHLADYMSQRPNERMILDKQLDKVPMSSTIRSKIKEYNDFREGRSEWPPCYPSSSIVPLLQMAMNQSIVSCAFLGSDAESYGFGQSSNMDTSLPNVLNNGTVLEGDLPMRNIQPTPSTNTIVKTKRRTMTPAEMAPLKERLNQISAD